MKRSALISLLIGASVLFSCEFLHQPEQEEPLDGQQQSEDNNSNKIQIFKINSNEQICNPSISQDTGKYKGNMLWLNFAGNLNVIKSEGFTTQAAQHDRLTITNHQNTVTWYMMTTELGSEEGEEFQDPEWSTHPEYIVSLLSRSSRTIWDCYAIHLESKNRLKLCEGKMDGESTPHLWVPPSSKANTHVPDPKYTANGFAIKNDIISFFGTDSVKLVYSLMTAGVLSISYVDYAGSAEPVVLKKPVGKESWNCESALISPDGKWIVYNAFQSPFYYESYIQRLAPDSYPELIKSGASDPHWWKNPANPSSMYIIYAEIPGLNFVEADLSDQSLIVSGAAGRTMAQQIDLSSDVLVGLSIWKTGTPSKVVNIPVKGGLSPDGHFMCTGYKYAYIIKM